MIERIFQKAFTPAEFMVALAVTLIFISALSVAASAIQLKTGASRALSDLQTIARRLEDYKTEYGSYPLSCGVGNTWASREVNPWGCALDVCWIPQFSGEGWCPLPANHNPPPPGFTAAESQYLYVTNASGTEYKLIYFAPLSLAVPAAYLDPERPTWAFGIWSKGGVSF